MRSPRRSSCGSTACRCARGRRCRRGCFWCPTSLRMIQLLSSGLTFCHSSAGSPKHDTTTSILPSLLKSAKRSRGARAGPESRVPLRPRRPRRFHLPGWRRCCSAGGSGTAENCSTLSSAWEFVLSRSFQPSLLKSKMPVPQPPRAKTRRQPAGERRVLEHAVAQDCETAGNVSWFRSVTKMSGSPSLS